MKHLVVFTGAGISQESGICTFRDKNGLWKNHNVDLLASIDSWPQNKTVMLDFYNQRRRLLREVQPNDAHRILAELESSFRISIITQNVDDLHEKAGSKQILHLHGELTKACNEDKTEIVDIGYNEIQPGDMASDGTQLRPFIVWFGEAVPLMEQAIETVKSADILLVVGTSLMVYPAANLLNYVPTTVPIYLVDPNPRKHNRAIIIPQVASKGMATFRDFLLHGKELPVFTSTPSPLKEELKVWTEAIKRDPNNIDYWLKKSEILGKLERYEEAMICQDRIEELMGGKIDY